MLPNLNYIYDSQATPTNNKKLSTDMLLDYSHTYPNANIRFHTSNMILHIKLDDAYLVIMGDCSRIAAHWSLSDHPTDPTNPSDANINVPILMECKSLWHVVGYAAEYETGGLFINGQKIVPIQTALIKLHNLQPKHPLKADNSTSKGYSVW